MSERDVARGPRWLDTFGVTGAHLGVLVPNLRECLYLAPSTICNLRCRFCAYPKSSLDKRVMPNRLFGDVLDKACEYGFTKFGLTPLLGEPLTDPQFSQKLELLERHPGVLSYSFCTNFTLANAPFIDGLQQLKKLRSLAISIYGHDADSLSQVAEAGPQVFQQLLRNLERLSRWPDAANRAELRIRTAVSPESPVWQPELRSLVQRLQAAGVRVRVPNKEYSNWGGLVSATDVAGLDLRLRPASAPRDLPCALLFYKHTVLPDGKLNACYGGDGNATLVIGDLTRSTFDDIYSSRNERYVQLVRGHFEGRFGPTCQACTGYRSLRDQHYSYAFHETPFLSLAEFLEQLDRHGGIPGGGECGAPGSSSS